MEKPETRRYLAEYFSWHNDTLLSFKRFANENALTIELDSFDEQYLYICRIRDENKSMKYVLAYVACDEVNEIMHADDIDMLVQRFIESEDNYDEY